MTTRTRYWIVRLAADSLCLIYRLSPEREQPDSTAGSRQDGLAAAGFVRDGDQVRSHRMVGAGWKSVVANPPPVA